MYKHTHTQTSTQHTHIHAFVSFIQCYTYSYNNTPPPPTHTHYCSGCYLGIYAIFSAGQIVSVLIASFSLAIAGVYASRSLHSRMLKNILRSPMSFFDTTPLGRVLNRFSKDIYLVDEVVPKSIRKFFFTGLRIFSTILVIMIATPTFAIVILPLSIFYSLVQVLMIC